MTDWHDIKPDPLIFPKLWPIETSDRKDDFLIYLREPFMKHYQGSVFRLGEPDGISGWEDDYRLREKINFSDKRTYRLPDNGRGLPVELSKSMTGPMPFEQWFSVDISSGPWRITSMIHFLDGKETSMEVLPLGQPPMVVSPEYNGNLIIQLDTNHESFTLKILEKQSQVICLEREIMTAHFYMPVQAWPPGFYQIWLTLQSGESWSVSAIKMFPFFVQSHQNNNLQLTTTLW